ncbi:hypothetical protein KUH32_07310 [Thalassococcus sp. CAU 1522]|uniref:Uncharacterized protein n=1 Tax=Thalassococcus arenae TaxID=2851652 RepID=A0ABS6N6E4_9RHOB|nr:hypothetical protein [Thalassococcus arenae]MBV2359576.1 hypothetical protein [Thalassococcus arenae]
MLTQLALPTLVLMALALAVPRLGERLVPETLVGLVALGIGSAIMLWLLSAAGFALSYLWRSPEVADLLGVLPGSGARHFLVLGLKAGLIWGPVLILAVSTAPRRWKTERW